MPFKAPPYMTPLSLEDLNAINELATLTWSWNIKYWTEKGLSHGSFIVYACDPNTNSWVTLNGSSLVETINKFKNVIEGV